MDKQWNELVQKIIDTGHMQKEEDANTYYKDGEKARTIYTIGETFEFDGTKAAIMSGKEVRIEKAIGELLWIYKEKSGNLDLLKNKYGIGFWDDWDIGNRTIGPAYGSVVYNKRRWVDVDTIDQEVISKEARAYIKLMEAYMVELKSLESYDSEKPQYVEINVVEEFYTLFDRMVSTLPEEDTSSIRVFPGQNKDEQGNYKMDSLILEYRPDKEVRFLVPLDQMDYLLNSLKTNPYSRRHIITLYDPSIVDYGGLPPCVWNNTWFVTPDNKLHLEVTSRSSDLALGNPFNTIQYHVFQHMVAQVLGYEVGKFRFHMGNPHIYDRHKEGCEAIIRRNKTNDTPQIVLNKEVTNFYDFEVEDVSITNYHPEPFVRFEIAVHNKPEDSECAR